MIGDIRNFHGAPTPLNFTQRYTSGTTTLNLPQGSSSFYLENTTASSVSDLVSGRPPGGGRMVKIRNDSANTVTFNNTAYGSLAEGKMHLRGSNRALAQGSVLVLEQLANGAWVMVSFSG